MVFIRSSGSWTIPFAKRLIQQVISIAHDTHIQLVLQKQYDTTFPFETPAKLLQRLVKFHHVRPVRNEENDSLFRWKSTI